MKYFEFDKDEQQLINDFEAGQLTPVPDFRAQKAKLQASARVNLNKTRNINIRLSERDIQKLKARAAKEGLPYQTLASSILHRVADE